MGKKAIDQMELIYSIIKSCVCFETILARL